MEGYSENALNVFKKLYFKKDKNGNLIEQYPNEVFRRVSSVVANDNKELEQKFYSMMVENYFRPCTPCLINVGVQEKPQTAACFVGGMKDDLISIFDFDKESGIIFASGSGIGGNFGVLREKDALLSSGGRSSGPLVFLKKWAATAEAVKSGGSSRRAAELAMFFDDHPDLLEFITIKDGEDQKALRSMNLSVAVSDAFMEAVENDEMWELYGVVDGKVKSKHKARDIFNKIAVNAHKTGDPGVWFIGRTNESNGLLAQYGQIISTNPCGELPLHSHGCCTLGSINLAKFIIDGNFDYDKFREIVKLGIYFLDNMLSISGYPTYEYKSMAENTRPLGLGIMGLADMLCLLDIPYDSEFARELCWKISNNLNVSAIHASRELAKKYGAFSDFERNRDGMTKLCAKFGVTLELNEQLRNSSWTTIAPTGTISISADCSPGMEPLFGICYTKNISDSNEKWIFVNPIFKEKYKDEKWYDKAIKEIAENHGSCQGIECVPIEVQNVWKVAHDINWKDRIEMQAQLQQNISSAISSTINLPKSATVDEIKAIYKLAWERGLKGITVYRDGSLDEQPVEFEQKKEKTIHNIPYERPRVLHGKSYLVKTAHGKMYFTINTTASGKVIEIFSNGGKNGNVSTANLEAIARLSSLALQYGAPVEAIAHTLVDINDGKGSWDKLLESDKKAVRIDSIPDAVGKVLYKFYINEENEVKIEEKFNTLKCPECGGPAVLKEGCTFCPQCGSKCG